MKQTFRMLAVALAGAGFMALAATPALCSDEFCAMGGTLIKAEIDKEKALEWGKDRKKVVVTDEDADTWTVLTLSNVDDDIAILVSADGVFYGVAGRGGQEVTARDVSKIFGTDLRKLREAVKKDMGELRKAGAVQVGGSDIQDMSDAVGFGILEKGREWELTTQDCTGVDLDASELK